MFSEFKKASVALLPMAERKRFQLLNDALTNCTSYWAQFLVDGDGDSGFGLFDGCGDMDGDLFFDLEDLELYIRNNEEVDQYLLIRSMVPQL